MFQTTNQIHIFPLNQQQTCEKPAIFSAARQLKNIGHGVSPGGAPGSGEPSGNSWELLRGVVFVSLKKRSVM